MNFNQNEKLKQVAENTLIIGVDIASNLHHARAFDWRGFELAKVFKFENDIIGFENFLAWIASLMKIEGMTTSIIGAEPTGHYWYTLAEFLKDNDIKLVLVNPYHVKKSKELDDNHPSKSDSKDPKIIAKLVIEGRYNEPYIPEGIYAELRIATSSRLRITNELIGIKNRIQRWIKIYFPEYSTVFRNIDGVGSMIILHYAPLPGDILDLGPERINRIWREKKIKAVGICRAKSLYEAAQSSIGCAGSMACKMEIELLLEDYDAKKIQYESVMMVIEELCKKIPEVEKLMEIKGIGLVTVSGFIAEVGDIRRFNSPKQIQKLAGLALVESSSGKHKGQTTISKRGRSRLRALLFQAVLPLVAKNTEFREMHKYYTTRTKNPLKKMQSMIALCCKLIRVFYAVLKNGVIYDPVKLVNDIHRPAETVAA